MNHTAYSFDYISCHFHILFSVTAYVWESVSVLWGAGIAALQDCQHLPLILTPAGDAAIQKCPSVLLPPPARSVCVRVLIPGTGPHTFTLQDCLWFAVAPSPRACRDSASLQLPPSMNRNILQWRPSHAYWHVTFHFTFHLEDCWLAVKNSTHESMSVMSLMTRTFCAHAQWF